MKKLTSILAMLLVLAISMVPALAEAPADAALKSARAYLNTMYKKSPETTMTDYDVVGSVNIGGTAYPVTWTADSETIKITAKEDGMVTIDVDEKNPEEVAYVLTATITSPVTGETAEVSFKHKVPAAMILDGLSYEEIVAAAYTLEDGVAMTAPTALAGEIVTIDTAWSEDYQNITVTIAILIVGYILLLQFEPHHDPIALLFEAVSAIATVGVSMDLTPQLSTSGRLVIMALMFIGRVGPLTVLLSLLQKKEKEIQYAQTNITVG